MANGSTQPVILWLQIRATEDDVGADNRNACDKGGFQGEGAQILHNDQAMLARARVGGLVAKVGVPIAHALEKYGQSPA